MRHLPLPRPALYESWHRLRRPRVERATGAVDVIHATAMPVPPRSRPLIVTIHDLAWMADPAHFTRHGVRFFDRGLELARGDADLVVCPSEATASACVEAGFESERVRVVPLGVETARATEHEIESVRRRHGLARSYLLWTGTVEPRKNLARLIEAYRELDPPELLVLVGPSGWNEDLDALVAPVRDRVRVLGFVPRSDLGPLYAGARAFCFPSLLEGFGFPVLEAMAQGTPVVTSRGTSTEELGRDAAVLVDPLDVASIAAGMATALDDDGVSAGLREAGPPRAAEYSWERTADLLLQAYREVSPG